jgi:hypothetical protein
MEQFILIKDELLRDKQNFWVRDCITNTNVYRIRTSINHKKRTISVDTFVRLDNGSSPPYTGRRFLHSVITFLLELYPHLSDGYLTVISSGTPINRLPPSNKTKEDIIDEYGKYSEVIEMLNDPEEVFESYGAMYSFIKEASLLNQYYIRNFGLEVVDDSEFPRLTTLSAPLSRVVSYNK